ncbi:MAG TPA: 4'-phosphopantetheinyl transferase superfamily protein [Vicinamibacteria bacterium]|nr:4'-phosphopantetheinyl transferase superfamily protein [Vicinamibacteria bacterium]
MLSCRGTRRRSLVIGVGIDLVEVERVGGMLERWGQRLLVRILAPDERDALPASPEERTMALARAIALKEAASKAIGTGWSRGVGWRDVVVDPGPPPSVRLRGAAAAAARALGGEGGTTASLEARGSLVLGQVRLLG